MRALLITLTGIHEVELPDDDGPDGMAQLNTMYELIDCRMVCGAGYPDMRHAAWADDEGLMTMRFGTPVHDVKWYPEPLVGNLLITGFDPESGETAEATLGKAALGGMISTQMAL